MGSFVDRECLRIGIVKAADVLRCNFVQTFTEFEWWQALGWPVILSLTVIDLGSRFFQLPHCHHDWGIRCSAAQRVLRDVWLGIIRELWYPAVNCVPSTVDLDGGITWFGNTKAALFPRHCVLLQPVGQEFKDVCCCRRAQGNRLVADVETSQILRHFCMLEESIAPCCLGEEPGADMADVGDAVGLVGRDLRSEQCGVARHYGGDNGFDVLSGQMALYKAEA